MSREGLERAAASVRLRARVVRPRRDGRAEREARAPDARSRPEPRRRSARRASRRAPSRRAGAAASHGGRSAEPGPRPSGRWRAPRRAPPGASRPPRARRGDRRGRADGRGRGRGSAVAPARPRRRPSTATEPPTPAARRPGRRTRGGARAASRSRRTAVAVAHRPPRRVPAPAGRRAARRRAAHPGAARGLAGSAPSSRSPRSAARSMRSTPSSSRSTTTAPGPCASRSPRARRRGRSATCWPAGRGRQRRALRAQRHAHGRRGEPARRALHAAARHELRRRDRGAHDGPQVKVVPTFNVTVPEGLSIREAAPVARQAGRSRAATRGGARASRAAAHPPARRPAGHPHAEGFMFPATYALAARQPRARPREQAARRVRGQLQGIDMRYAQRRNLTRYDVLIIASMVEREVQLDKERPLAAAVIYNRLARGMPLGIDATIRYEAQLGPPAAPSELEKDTPYNTRIRTGPAADADRQPRPQSLEAAANPARKDYIFYVVKPCGEGEHAFSSTEAQFARDLQHTRPRARSAAASRPPTVDDLPRRLRLAGRALALAADAERRAGGGRPGRLALPAAAAAARAVRGDRPRAARGRLPRRQRDDPAQGGGARARRRGDRRRAGDRRGQHADLRGRRDQGRQHRCAGPAGGARRAGGGPSRARARRGRIRRGRRRGRWRRPAPRSRSGTARRSARGRLRVRWACARWRRPSRPTSWSTARRSGSTIPTTRSRLCRSGPMN